LKIGITFNVRLASHSCQPELFNGKSNGRFPSGLALPLDDHDEEFDSPETIAALAHELEGLGHEVELLGDGPLLVERLAKGPKPDLVWNLAEGAGNQRSREARVPALLEMLDIPYTGSDPLTLAATLDKDCAKRLIAQAGLATPAWELFLGDWNEAAPRLARLRFPVFVKPAYEGSSKGIIASSIIANLDQLRDALEQLLEVYKQPVLIEEFIDGDELTVGLVGNDPPDVLGIMRVLPNSPTREPFVYSLEIKRNWQRLVRYECPAKLSAGDFAAVKQAALGCWQAIGCRDVARVDFRLREGVPYILEANPLPGISPNSGDLVLLSRAMGIDYPHLVRRILQAALERLNLKPEVSMAR
jgi:D-alanine-D-alanine ligase